jgi:flagellar hook-length control protein FliK
MTQVEFTPVTAGLTETPVQTLTPDTVLPEEEQPQETVTVTSTETVAVSNETTEAPVQQATDTKAPTNEEQTDLPTDTNTQKDDTADITVTEAPAAEPQPIFHQVQSHMIKVGETAKSDASEEASDIGQQIADQLSGALEQGDTKVQVQLTPQSLGSVTVDVTQQKDGTLHIVLSAENSHTRALLGQHTEALQGLLSGQSQKPVQVEVSRSQEQQRQNQSYDGRNGNSQQNAQQEQQHRQNRHDEDFLQQLRLGLIPLDIEAS